ARHPELAAARTAAMATRQAREQIREIGFVERVARFAELAAPVRRRLEIFSGPVSAELVVSRALLGIFERLVRFRDFLEFLLALRILRHVRMILMGELAIGFLDVVRARAALDPEDAVVVLVFHGRCLAVRSKSGAKSAGRRKIVPGACPA